MEEGEEVPTMVDYQDYSTWLAEWNNNLKDGSTISQVPSSAKNIHTFDCCLCQLGVRIKTSSQSITWQFLSMGDSELDSACHKQG